MKKILVKVAPTTKDALFNRADYLRELKYSPSLHDRARWQNCITVADADRAANLCEKIACDMIDIYGKIDADRFCNLWDNLNGDIRDALGRTGWSLYDKCEAAIDAECFGNGRGY